MANFTSHYGNIYVFPSYTVGDAVKLEFDRPIKKFRFCSSGPAITSDAGTGKAVIAANSDIDLPSIQGLPDYLMYQGTAAAAPVVMVLEFGVSANTEYWKEV